MARVVDRNDRTRDFNLTRRSTRDLSFLGTFERKTKMQEKIVKKKKGRNYVGEEEEKKADRDDTRDISKNLVTS